LRRVTLRLTAWAVFAASVVVAASEQAMLDCDSTGEFEHDYTVRCFGFILHWQIELIMNAMLTHGIGQCQQIGLRPDCLFTEWRDSLTSFLQQDGLLPNNSSTGVLRSLVMATAEQPASQVCNHQASFFQPEVELIGNARLNLSGHFSEDGVVRVFDFLREMVVNSNTQALLQQSLAGRCDSEGSSPVWIGAIAALLVVFGAVLCGFEVGRRFEWRPEMPISTEEAQLLQEDEEPLEPLAENALGN